MNFLNSHFKMRVFFLLLAVILLCVGFPLALYAQEEEVQSSPVDSFGEGLSDYIDADGFEITEIEEIEVTAQVADIEDQEPEEESFIDSIIRNISEAANTVSDFLRESKELKVITFIGAPIALLPSFATFALSDIPILIYKIILGLLNAIGLRKKGKNFGYVYDSKTKEPLSLAVIRFFDENDSLMQTEVTNSYGHFNSNLEPGKYRITTTKSKYVFPSKIVTGILDYPISNVYHGQLQVLDNENITTLSIPLDPERLTYSEQLRVLAQTSLYQAWHTLGTILFFIGIFQSTHNYIFEPNDTNFLILVFYLALLIIVVYRSNIEKRKMGIVTYEGKPKSDIELLLKKAQDEKILDKRISKSDGSYNFVVSRGIFEILVNSEEYEIAEQSKNILENKQNKPVIYSQPIEIVKKPDLVKLEDK